MGVEACPDAGGFLCGECGAFVGLGGGEVLGGKLLVLLCGVLYGGGLGVGAVACAFGVGAEGGGLSFVELGLEFALAV